MDITVNKDDLRKQLFLAEAISAEVLQIIHTEKWLRIWVPERYNGLGCSLSEGLSVLQQLAEIDGSLGWMVTLCSGANYFSRNLQPETATVIFKEPNVCFGGSGMLGGTAEKKGDSYLINGIWDYATGAPHLSHFTLNACMTENGRPILAPDGEPVFRSFVLDAAQVTLIPSWKTMGMVATASHSFEVKNQIVPADNSFAYNKFYTEDALDRVPFEVFADLTLLVNYLGMAAHFTEASLKIRYDGVQGELAAFIEKSTAQTHSYAAQIEQFLLENKIVEPSLITAIHQFGEDVVEGLIGYIVKLYPVLGIKASRVNEEINQVFRDFFTATQHKNFRRSTQ